MSISFDADTCRNLDVSIAAEWLCTNGLGGYASGTVAGVNTRKYHGLLVVAAKPPVQRYVVLSRVEERLVMGNAAGEGPGGGVGAVYDLSTNEFTDIIHPQGYRLLAGFDLAGPGGAGGAGGGGPDVANVAVISADGFDS